MVLQNLVEVRTELPLEDDTEQDRVANTWPIPSEDFRPCCVGPKQADALADGSGDKLSAMNGKLLLLGHLEEQADELTRRLGLPRRVS